MRYKVDIFKLLDGISKNDISLIDSLSEEELKEVSPFFLQMWLKCPDNNFDGRMCLTNEIINPYILSLSAHKKLLYKLMCVAHGFDIQTRYYLSKNKKISVKKHLIAIMDYYKCNEREARDYSNLLQKDDIIEIAEALGYDDEEVKEITNEI